MDRALAEMAQDRVIERIWAGDHTVWRPEPDEIVNRLGWLSGPETMARQLEEIRGFAEEVRAEGFTHALLLGMGGSSLAPEVFRKVFGVEEGFLDLGVLDSTDPGAVLAQTDRLDPARALFIVSTKSGGTVETLSFFKFFYNWVSEGVGPDEAGRHFVAVTDPKSGLAELAERYRFRRTFLSDPNIGGRFSVFSPFGLLPAALTGMDVAAVLERAAEAVSNCRGAVDDPAATNVGAHLGAVMGVLAEAGRDKLTLVSSPATTAFGPWVEQLVAESTGKDGRGVLPVDAEPLGGPEVYGDDRLFVHMRLDGDATHDGQVAALAAAGHPVVRMDLRDLHDLGTAFFCWEMATAVAGYRLDIQPFDQPDVESAKVCAREMMAAYEETGALPELTPALEDEGIAVYGDAVGERLGEALEAFLGQAGTGDYISLQAYLTPEAETTELLQAIQTHLRDRLRLATTVGYGPRFLHSTGQLHKGDGGKGLFIQITAQDTQDVAIPDEAGRPESSATFGVLKAAQALGDRQALLDAGRRVLRVDLGREVEAGLRRMKEEAGKCKMKNEN